VKFPQFPINLSHPGYILFNFQRHALLLLSLLE